MVRATAVVLLLVAAGSACAGPDDDRFFAEKVQPLLQTHCYGCHSHEANKIKGGLALDSRSGWEQGGETGPALVPGQPEKSLLIKAVRQTDPELKMPPKGRLPDADIAVLVDWVQRGAPDPRRLVQPVKSADWWAIRPLSRPTVPPLSAAKAGPDNPIDHFILAGLAAKGLTMAPEADRRTLLRRLTFDLTGLPPTPEETEAFVRDTDPQAYDKVVDRLLASPRYGERMARLWLDVAHYGESNGFGMDRPRLNAWPYRDYVIRAFNEDKPYGRFIKEQLAADALFPNDSSLIPALGFLAAGPFNQSALAEQVDGTRCKKMALNLDRDDMASSVASSFLSVTLHCARCHDHKFDPISQRDYYRMQAVFAGVVRGERTYGVDAAVVRERERWQRVQKRLAAGEAPAALDEAERVEVLAALAEAEKGLFDAEKSSHMLNVATLTDSGLPKVVDLPDGSVRFEGETAAKDVYTLSGRSPLTTVAALRLEVLTDETLPHRGPGRNADNGNFHLSEIQVLAAPLTAPEKAVPIRLRAAFADFNQADWDIGKAIDGRPETAWGIHPQEGRSHQAVFLFEQPVSNPGGILFTIRLEQSHGRQHVLGRLRLSLTEREPATDHLLSPDVLVLLKTPSEQRSAEVRTRLADALVRPLIERKLAALPPPGKVFAVGGNLPPFRNYKAPKEPPPIHVLRRGDVDSPLAEVGAGALEIVTVPPPIFTTADDKDESERRAALALWISDERNPLTWRSVVNRAWLWHFDRGLVDTPNDFGRMGSVPSHPELLDWLACDFRDSGGSFKRLHRLIVTSAAYRQASPANDEAARLDGDNRLLWRMNRRRLDAEELRDALLSVSGRLDLTMGGPSVMQFNFRDPNPEVSPLIDYDGFDPDSPASRRRAVYRFLFRNVNDPLLDAFDAVNPSLSTPRREATVTPMQALSLYNNRFVLRQCEHLAARLQREAADPAARIERAFQLLYARSPTAEESALLVEYARKHGLAQACRVLVNANEFLFLR